MRRLLRWLRRWFGQGGREVAGGLPSQTDPHRVRDRQWTDVRSSAPWLAASSPRRSPPRRSRRGRSPGSASHRPTSPSSARARRRGLPAGTARARLRRGPEHRHRVPMGRGEDERLPALAAELVRSRSTSSSRRSTPAALAAKQATTTIPIVMAARRRPGGERARRQPGAAGRERTGLSTFAPELDGKRLELLKEAVPGSLGSPSSGIRPAPANARSTSKKQRGAGHERWACRLRRRRRSRARRLRPRLHGHDQRACRGARRAADAVAVRPASADSSTWPPRTGCRRCTRPRSSSRPAA